MSDFCPNCGYELDPKPTQKELLAFLDKAEAQWETLCEKCWGADSTSIHDCLSSECECDGPHH